MHAIICILYVIFNKVNKVQAKNKVQKFELHNYAPHL